MKKILLLPLSIMLFAFSGWAQQKSVSGTILDENGGPLPGATVLVEGTDRGVSSDFDGNYSIEVSEGEVLVITFIGYADQSITVGSSDVYNVSLAIDNQLEEVVVTSYGQLREKKSLGFSQQSVAGAAITQAKETDISNALAGKVAGIQIIGDTSTAFGNSTIRLRGSDNVLYVVDGIRIYWLQVISILITLTTMYCS